LRKSADELRDRALSRVFPEDADEIRISDVGPAGPRRILIRKEKPNDEPDRFSKAEWKILEPKVLRADQVAVGDLLRALQAARAETFEAFEPAKAEAAGLGAKKVRLEVRSGASREETRLLVGSRDAAGLRAFRREDGPEILRAKADALDPFLTADPIAFRDREVLKTEAFRVATMTIQRDGKRFELSKTGEGRWQITSPILARADETAVNAILEALGPLRAERILSEESKDPAALASFGLKDPAIRIEIFEKTDVGGKKEEKTWRLLIAGGDGPANASLEGGPAFVIPVSTVRTIRAELRMDKAVLSFDPAKATKVTVKAGASLLSFEKKGEGWAGGGGDLSAEAVERTLESLADVSAIRFLEYEAKDLKPFGLDPPDRTYEIVADGKTVALHVGSKRGLDVCVRNPANRAVGLVDAGLAARWPVSLDALKPPKPEAPKAPEKAPEGKAPPEKSKVP
ncbi:MAG: DUF4340 domain-containing protein, partial [Planctomycetota bacterium]